MRQIDWSASDWRASVSLACVGRVVDGLAALPLGVRKSYAFPKDEKDNERLAASRAARRKKYWGAAGAA